MSKVKLWRTLVRVEHTNRKEIIVVLPGWKAHKFVSVTRSTLPKEVRGKVKRGTRLTAMVNIGAETVGELIFEWEDIIPDPCKKGDRSCTWPACNCIQKESKFVKRPVAEFDTDNELVALKKWLKEQPINRIHDFILDGYWKNKPFRKSEIIRLFRTEERMK